MDFKTTTLLALAAALLAFLMNVGGCSVSDLEQFLKCFNVSCPAEPPVDDGPGE